MPNWTREQEQAIYKSGTNIIVSAGAGSGKTAVLSERVLQKVLNGVSIDRLLILTFTNLAAREMKERIRKKIKKDKSLINQLNKLDGSYITTFDSYSLSLVKKYHYLLNISRNVNIIDKNILDMEVSKYLDEIFENRYQNQDKLFLNLINDFCIKDDKSIKQEILKLNDKLNMRYDKDTYLNSYFDVYYSDEFIDKRILEYINLVKDKVRNIDTLINKLYDFCDSDYVNDLLNIFTPLNNAQSYEDYLVSFNIKLPNLKRCSEEEAKKIKACISDELKNVKNMLIFENTNDMKKSILDTKNYLECIISIIRELDEKVNDYKHQNDLYDFVDISKLAIKIVKENEGIREEIKNYFEEILVDEYQDTSDLQEEFISLIANNNVYMVGDIKQSIYRFRNANPNIFKNKYDNYSNHQGGEKIDLLKNFRSRREVLDNINLFFEFILDDYIGGADYRSSHEMVFGNNTYEETGKTNQDYNMEIYEYFYDKKSSYNKNEIEAFIIANDIKEKVANHYQIFDKDNQVLRDITYNDFVILIDRSTPFELYKKIFLYLQVPITILIDEYLNKSNDLLVIKNIFNLIKLVKEKNFSKEFVYSFLSVSRSFLFNYDDNTIFKIISEKSYENTVLYQKITNILNDIDSLTINEVLDKIIIEFNYYEALIKVGNVKESIVRIDYLNELASNLTKLGYTYLAFAKFIDNIFNEERDIRFSLDSESGNSVKIMSIHKSKGLEYHLCYFPCLYPKFNESDLKEKFIYDKELGIISPYFNEGIGDSFYKEIFKNNYKKEEIGEKIRLFYVALTRAKEKMIMVIPKYSLEEELDDYLNADKVVENDTRLHYNSFLSMINSIKIYLKDYIKEIDINNLSLTKKYNLVKKDNVFENIKDVNEKIVIKKTSEIKEEKILESHFSKSNNQLIDKQSAKNLEFGTHMHYLLEMIDFNNIDNYDIEPQYKGYIKKFINSALLKNLKDAKVYKEYEFIYSENNEIKHGIIDLMLEYEEYIDIIDYKLKNIDDSHYYDQLKGYQEYIMHKTKKDVHLYLYSIISGEYEKIN